MMKKPDFLHFDTDSWKLVWLKNVLGQSGVRTSNLAVSQEGINGIY